MYRAAGLTDRFIDGGKPEPRQPYGIFRLGKECSLDSRLVAEHDVSQFSCMLLLVTALVLTACFGVAAWRITGGASEVTGSVPQHSIDRR